MKDHKFAQTLAYFVAFVALGMAMAALGPTLPGLAQQTATNVGEISYLFTVRSFGFLLGSLFSGRFYDRLRGHAVMAATIVAMAATMALMPLTTTLTMLLGVMLVLGTAEGALGVGGNALLVWVHGRRVAPYMNALHFFYGVGGVIAPLIIVRAIAAQNTVMVTYVALAILALPAALLLLALPSPQNPHRVEAATNAEPVNYLLVTLIALLLCLDIGAEVGYGGWIAHYVTRMQLGDERMGNFLTSIFWGALTLGRLICVPLALRLRPRIILLADLLGCLASLAVALLWSASLTAITIATVCIGLSMGSIYPTVLTFAERRMNISGQVMSFFIVGGSVGGMLVPMLIGQLFDSIGARVMLFALLLDLLLAVLVYVAMVVRSTAKQGVESRE